MLWIGHLQWHIRTKGGLPSEPILRAFKNIVVRDAVLAADTRLLRDWSGKLVTKPGPDGKPVEVTVYDNPRRPEWPETEFIVGNPPFIGSKYLRARLGDDYTEALWAAHPEMNDAADYVMYWWDYAAGLLTRNRSVLRQFGFVTTNSITQSFQSCVLDRHLRAKRPISLVMAVPNHPWTKATADAAAVRIAMTVGAAGVHNGLLRKVTREIGIDTDSPIIEFVDQMGSIHSDLTIGADLTAAVHLKANDGICSPGVKLHGSGFIVTPNEAAVLGLGKREGLEKHIRAYRNGRDLTARPRNVMVIDLFGLDAEDFRMRFPEVYQHVLQTVKPERDINHRESYRTNWWVFGEPRPELRPALSGLSRYIATPVTQKHRTFEFVPAAILPDDALMVITDEDAYCLGVLHSRPFAGWFAGNSSTLEDRPRFIKSRCFDPFPFPAANDLQKQRIRNIAEDLDAHRKRVLAEHSHLTLTGLYNVLERLRAGVGPDAFDEDEKRIFDDGLVLILKELHDKAMPKNYCFIS